MTPFDVLLVTGIFVAAFLIGWAIVELGDWAKHKIEVHVVRALDMPIDYYLVDTAPVLYDQDPVLLGGEQ